MKKLSLSTLLGCAAILLGAVFFTACSPADKQVVIVFTNDTHSQIDPLDDTNEDYPGMGGVERRKVLIDSLRAEHPDLLLADAGDVVQGTPYFNVFGGEVETLVMNTLHYNVRTQGNHEFDNGMEALAAMLRACDATTVSTNYKTDGTTLDGIVVPSLICRAGDVKVGFIGLDVQPKGLIDSMRCTGIEYVNPLLVADSAALALRRRGADVVVALSHLGYDDANNTGEPTDPDIVAATSHIDFVIGGHSHTLLPPPSLHANRDNDSIVIAQTGKHGAYVGVAYITIPADRNKRPLVDYRLMPIDSRYDNRIDTVFKARLDVYRHIVDSIMNVVIGKTDRYLDVDKPESLLTNWVCDAFADIARERTGAPIDFAVVNTGGVRTGFDAGDLTRGELFTAFPFDNCLAVVTLRGKDVKELFDIIALRGGEGVSREVALTIRDKQAASLTIGGKPVDDDRLYTIATLDYVANGGDKMSPFTQAVSRTDYPDPVRNMLEAYISRLTARGLCVTATRDGRIKMAR